MGTNRCCTLEILNGGQEGRGGSLRGIILIFYLLTSDDIYCYILKLYKYFKCLEAFKHTQPHKYYLCETNSIQKQEQQDRFEKDDNKNNMKQEQKSKEVITTSTV